jgi:hypothetical protein
MEWNTALTQHIDETKIELATDEDFADALKTVAS